MENYLSLVRDEYIYLCDYNQVINSNMKDLFLKHGEDRKIKDEDVDIDEGLLKRKIKKLPQFILEISQKCNLRCKYCIYGASYRYQRNFSDFDMSFETARKGIDYVFSFIKNRKKKQFALSFYGGEPLLNFKTMKRAVEYAKKLFTGWDLRFNLTTNLTVLNKPLIDFLVDNRISLLVSLDGDRGNHDAKRVFADGKGSHKIVMKNLEKIADRDGEYFQEKVSFSTVYSFDLPLKNLYNFFTTNTLIKNKRMRFGGVDRFDTTYYDIYPCDKEAYNKDFQEIISLLLEKVRKGEDLGGFETAIFGNFKKISSLKTRHYDHLAGTCLFDSRLYLAANGEFHVCEKVNHTLSFGDIHRGFDFAKMVRMAGEFAELNKTTCSNCPVKYLCERCYASFAGNGKFRIDPQFCKSQKEAVMSKLERYIQYKEEKLV